MLKISVPADSVMIGIVAQGKKKIPPNPGFHFYPEKIMLSKPKTQLCTGFGIGLIPNILRYCAGTNPSKSQYFQFPCSK
jgi:hypothetical protein